MAMSGGHLHAAVQWALNVSEYKNQPLIAFFLVLFSRLHIDDALSACVMSVFLISYFGILNKSIREYGSNTWAKLSSFVYFFGFFNIINEASGLRNLLAFVITSLGIQILVLYKNQDRAKRDSLVGFTFLIIGFLIHPSASVLIAIAALSLLIPFRFRFILYAVLLFNQWAYTLVAQIVAQFSRIPFFSELQWKLQMYVRGGSEYSQAASRSEIIAMVLLFCSLVVLYTYINLVLRKNLNHVYHVLTVSLFCFTLGSFANTQIFLRYTWALFIILIPVIYQGSVSSPEIREQNLVRLLGIGLLGLAVMFQCWWTYVLYSHVLIW
jgi:hypothetical protein